MSRLQEFAKRLRDREGLYKVLIVLVTVVAATVTSFDQAGGQENTFQIATISAVAVVILWVFAAARGERR